MGKICSQWKNCEVFLFLSFDCDPSICLYTGTSESWKPMTTDSKKGFWDFRLILWKHMWFIYKRNTMVGTIKIVKYNLSFSKWTFSIFAVQVHQIIESFQEIISPTHREVSIILIGRFS